MTPLHLLPANATPLEQALSLASDPLPRLALDADALRRYKTEPTDALLPWLIWEYGLGELLPYLPEPRRAIAEGLRWQRLRGTPAALTTALPWIGMSATLEQEPPGVHFASFQLDPGRVLDDDAEIARLIAIARLSAPARSRLSRIFHGYDLRRMVLAHSRLGEALLSDHSGVFWQGDGKTKLSFGRTHRAAHPAPSAHLATAREAVRFATARLLDRVLLSFHSLGEPGHGRNPEIMHAHLRTLANALGVHGAQALLPERRFARAMVVLSDSTPLGDINANLPRFVWHETGHSLGLGQGDPLSATPHRLARLEVLERFFRDHPAALTLPGLTTQTLGERTSTHRVRARADQTLGAWMLGDSVPSLDQGSLSREHTRSNPALPDDTAGWRERRFQKAQVVLGEVLLGAVNTRTPRRTLVHLEPAPILGAMALGAQGTVRWRTLTEMHICISGLDGNAPYDFPDRSASHLLRLHAKATATNSSARVQPKRAATHSNRAAWRGQNWTGVRWPRSTWQDIREHIGSGHSSSHSTEP